MAPSFVVGMELASGRPHSPTMIRDCERFTWHTDCYASKA